MKTNEFKNTIFDYFYNAITKEFPELSNKVFRENLRANEPDFPYLTIQEKTRTRLNPDYENFYRNGVEYIRKQYRQALNFTIHDISEEALEAELFTDEVADWIESFFYSNPSTFIDLGNRGIVINEKLNSGIKNTGTVNSTSSEFVKEIEVNFEYEEITTTTSEPGKDIEISINPYTSSYISSMGQKS